MARFTRLLFSFLAFGLTLSLKAQDTTAVHPIELDQEALSGIGLKKIPLKNEPEREFFQKNLYRGPEISVYVVSSQTWPGQMDNFGIDEFLYVLNGQAHLRPEKGDEIHFEAGDYFFAHRGYTGGWETIESKKGYYYELSVITTQRAPDSVELIDKNPFLLDPHTLSEDTPPALSSLPGQEIFVETLAKGVELSVSVIEEEPQSRNMANDGEQLIGILAGKLILTATDGTSFTYKTGDWFILPKGFEGVWECEGHGLMRSIHIYKSR
ncbi:MAG: cupin domain-containing protein [Bacteroidota bacterium]